MLKKLIVTAALAAALLQAAPGHASTLVVDGEVLYTTAMTGTSGNCLPTNASCDKLPVSRHHRCAYLLVPDQAQSGNTGRLGYTIAIPADYKTFTLDSIPAGVADFDIVFYIDLGTCQNSPAPATYPAGVKSSFARFGPEAGVIPAGTVFAIVTVFGSNNAAFRFTAAK